MRGCGYDMLFGFVMGALIVLVSRFHMVMRGGGVMSRRGQMSGRLRVLGNRALISFNPSGLCCRRCHVCVPL